MTASCPSGIDSLKSAFESDSRWSCWRYSPSFSGLTIRRAFVYSIETSSIAYGYALANSSGMEGTAVSRRDWSEIASLTVMPGGMSADAR